MTKHTFAAVFLAVSLFATDAESQSRRPTAKPRVKATARSDTLTIARRDPDTLKAVSRPAGATAAISSDTLASGSPGSSSSRNTGKSSAKSNAPWNPFAISSFVTSVYDSNIGRDRADLESYGLIAGSSGRYQSSRLHPGLAATYTIAKHSYTRGEEWNRVSQDLNVVASRSLTRRLTLETVGEVTLKGSSEDRDVSDQYTFLPRLNYRLRTSQRVRLYGAYRVRRYVVTTERNAANRYAGLEFRQNVGKSGQWETGYRFETNSAREERRSYTRRTYATQYTQRVWDRDQIVGELKYRTQRYNKRAVRVDSVAVPRMDHRFQPSLTVIHQLSQRVGLELDYDFENRTSNDPRRGYHDHLFTLSSRYNW